MRRLLPAPKVRPPPVRRQEVTTVADAVASVQAAPVVTTAATAAFSGEQVITGTPDGTKFLRDDYSWQAAGAGGPAAELDTTGAAVDVSGAAPPTTGQVLTATDATHAIWQTPAGGAGADMTVLDWLGW